MKDKFKGIPLKREKELDRHSRDNKKKIKPGKGGKIQIDGSHHRIMGKIC